LPPVTTSKGKAKGKRKLSRKRREERRKDSFVEAEARLDWLFVNARPTGPRRRR